MSPTMSVLSVGAQTALGRNAASTAAALHAGMSRVSKHPIFLDRNYEQITAAAATWLEGSDLTERMCTLALGAIADAMVPLSSSSKYAALRLGVFLGLPSVREGLTQENIASVAVASKQSVLRIAGNVPMFDTFCEDHSAVTTALCAASEAFGRGRLDACLVGGVDSYLSRRTLSGLCDAGRLVTDDNPWGFVPGEAAAFLLLVPESHIASHGSSALLEVESVSVSAEPATADSGVICTGIGLRKAVEDVLSVLPSDGVCIDELLVDLNGEPYRADELAFSILGVSSRFRSPGKFFAHADQLGDIGAATGALQVVLGASGWPRSRPEPSRLLALSSAGRRPRRGATLMRRLEGRRESEFRWP